jgi:protoporphyrinogen oxidase
MTSDNKNIAIIIGAGPAGLTAALELLRKTSVKPIVLEASGDNGGISKTINHHGNRIDIGGHRFFSKSDEVMQWWLDIMPLQKSSSDTEEHLDVSYHHKSRAVDLHREGPDPEKIDDVMLVRNRVSRIYYSGKFFNYPLSLDITTIRNLGLARMMRIGLSYIKARIAPIRNEKSLEDFIINRFGKELYQTFFRDYTEKVWGIPCNKISPEWGAQRIKGLSISKAILHAIRQIFSKSRGLSQKQTETSLIERFMYPKYGPGHMWDTVASKVLELGGEIHYHQLATGIELENGKISRVTATDLKGNGELSYDCDYAFSTMPIKDLINSFRCEVPEETRRVANGLIYRDFITVGLLLDKLLITSQSGGSDQLVPDNWIYIQEPYVKIGRLQIFNNWSPYLVTDRDKVWIGLEYFCNEGDDLWQMQDQEFVDFAIRELEQIHIIDSADVRDSVLVRMPKTYPAYFGTYDELHKIRDFVDGIENLFLVGRNGMHKYNNQDHSMLTAITAVDNIARGITGKDNIWAVNTEEEYHEAKSS